MEEEAWAALEQVKEEQTLANILSSNAIFANAGICEPNIGK